MKHELRRLTKRVRRLEDKCRREHVALKDELVQAILHVDGDNIWLQVPGWDAPNSHRALQRADGAEVLTVVA